MLKRKTKPASARLPRHASVTRDASDAVVRLAVERPLGRGTLRSRLERVFLRFTRRGVWVYLLGVLGVLSIVQFETDRWWLGTVLSLGPTWSGLLPLALLVPLAAVLRARLLLPLLASTLCYLFGVMGLCVPWPWNGTQAAPTQMLTVMTWNVGGDAGDWKSVRQLIENENVDIVALQESEEAIDSAFPLDWHVVRAEGLTLAARFPIKDQQTWRREQLPPTRQQTVAFYALIEHPEGPVAICTVQLAAPWGEANELLPPESLSHLSRPDQIQRLIFWRDGESEALAKWIRSLPSVDLLAGDFNMSVESQIYRRWWASYVNAFSTVGSGFGWTTRTNAGKIAFGARIDHLLVANGWAPVSCEVGPDVGSDHLPVILQVVPASQW